MSETKAPSRKPGPGLHKGLPNKDYHASPGISKSQLDLIEKSPALLEWSKAAPVDEEAEKAVDIGNAFEALLLEPERFEREYLQGPKDAPRNTKDGKARWAEVEEEAQATGKTILSHDQWRQITLMRDSTMAHPVARRALNAGGLVQGSYYWKDPEVGLLCRCRPDWMMADAPFAIDVKTSGQIERFPASVEEYRYHVQDSFYSDGLANHYGQRPDFAFLVVSTSRSAGRYPVHVYELDEEDKQAGRRAYRRNLETYAQCVKAGDFTHVEPLARPWWARRRDEE